MDSLPERLGHPADTRLLIISSDQIGTTHASTVAGYMALRDGTATTGTVVMPGPWSRHAAELYRGEDIGVQLTLNSELESYRWGPLTAAPSLLDGDGGFPRTLGDLWDHADLDEVRRECQAQLERAVLWGFDVTHLSTHMGAMQQRPEFFDVMLDLATECDLPLRLESDPAESEAGFPFRRLASEDGIVYPDHFRSVDGGARAYIEQCLAELPPGVTEVSLTPAVDEAEVHAIDPYAAARVDDLDLLTGGDLESMVTSSGAVLIGYRELRSAQRDRH